MNVTDVLLHPVRLRIVHALAAGRQLTVGQLIGLMTDVSKVTIYRHIAVLVDAKFIEVAQEQRVRGAVERHYRLRTDRPSVTADDASAMTLDDHRRGFASAMLVLLAEFDAYVGCEQADPVADGVSYRQGTIWLTDDERSELTATFVSLFRRLAQHEASGERRPYLISPIFFPAARPVGGSNP
jgi:DNA-binding transcriptional ArsR family regulator